MFARSPYAEQFSWVCTKVGIDRLLFGSDFPLAAAAETVTAICALGFDESALHSIFRRNAATLFGRNIAGERFSRDRE